MKRHYSPPGIVRTVSVTMDDKVLLALVILKIEGALPAHVAAELRWLALSKPAA